MRYSQEEGKIIVEPGNDDIGAYTESMIMTMLAAIQHYDIHVRGALSQTLDEDEISARAREKAKETEVKARENIVPKGANIDDAPIPDETTEGVEDDFPPIENTTEELEFEDDI